MATPVRILDQIKGDAIVSQVVNRFSDRLLTVDLNELAQATVQD
jgi:hypothetical protein